MNPEATREIYWNVHFPGIGLVMLALGLAQAAVIARALAQRWKLWRVMGAGRLSLGQARGNAIRVFRHAFAHKRILRRLGAGWAHFALFWGFVLLFVGTLIVGLQAEVAGPWLHWHFFRGRFYLVYSLTLDLAGAAAIAAVLMFLIRRLVRPPESLGGKINYARPLWLLLVILLTGYAIEGLRLAHERPPLADWSPVGLAFSTLFSKWSESSTRCAHAALWWTHLALAVWLLTDFALGAMRHAFVVPLNVALSRGVPQGDLEPIRNMEEAETFGVAEAGQFRVKQLLDTDACVECGRCQDVCPAWATGKPLTPKKIITSIRDVWLPQAEAKLAGKTPPATPSLIGESITPDELWACTTCGACERECPALIEQIDKIVDLRRHLVLMKSDFPAELRDAFVAMETHGNPWGRSPEARADWAKGLDIPRWTGPGAAECLFWVGCAGSYSPEGQEISRACVRLLRAAGVSFAILGEEERCTGDPALRAGNDYLYQNLARANIETLTTLGVRRIVTACPHCFQTLGKEYQRLGAHFTVEHHSQLLERLLAEGRIKPRQRAANPPALHDPCYLARHNHIVEAPRKVLAAAAGAPPIEPPRSRDRTFCCGAGGARMWMEERIGEPICETRAAELLACGAPSIAVVCPFCKTMISDGVAKRGKAGAVRVRDIAEFLADALDDAP